MRVLMLLVWCMVPVLVGAYHLGPGQEQMVLGDAGKEIRAGKRCVAEENWPEAVGHFQSALELLPGDRVEESRRLRLEMAKAQMMARQLPVAHLELKSLVDDLLSDESVEPEMLGEARAALANSQYYMTWLMRLEGLPRDVWEPEIESARQIYRLLAESSDEAGDDEQLGRHQQDLEASIRLARMDLSELQGLPLPSQ